MFYFIGTIIVGKCIFLGPTLAQGGRVSEHEAWLFKLSKGCSGAQDSLWPRKRHELCRGCVALLHGASREASRGNGSGWDADSSPVVRPFSFWTLYYCYNFAFPDNELVSVSLDSEGILSYSGIWDSSRPAYTALHRNNLLPEHGDLKIREKINVVTTERAHIFYHLNLDTFERKGEGAPAAWDPGRTDRKWEWPRQYGIPGDPMTSRVCSVWGMKVYICSRV